ncbi:8440_t:CDS:1, partial [Funneliformis geosporum]
INPDDTRKEYVTFWNLLINTNIYGQVTRKYLCIETADIRYFNLITNDMRLESFIKYLSCFLN